MKKLLSTILVGVSLVASSSIASADHGFTFQEKEPNNSIADLKYEDPFTVYLKNPRFGFTYAKFLGSVDESDTVDVIKFTSEFSGGGEIQINAPDGQYIFATLYDSNGKEISSAATAGDGTISNLYIRENRIYYLELEHAGDYSNVEPGSEYQVWWYVDANE